LSAAFDGAESDLKRSIVSNKEVFDFLESAAKKYGIEVSFAISSPTREVVLG
jgi:homoaconitase